MKRRLILHLGLWKTGTTTIQTFLRQNPDALAAIGVHYPRVGPDNPDHPFFRMHSRTPFLGKEVNHQALGQEIMRRGRGVAGSHIETPLWSTAFQRIEESGAHTAIISYEDFSARTELYRFDALASRLGEFDVHGVIYLRHQEEWAISLYAHLIRGARHAQSFADFLESIQNRLDYSAVLARIRDHVPVHRLVVGTFEQATASGLLKDFFARTGLPRAPTLSADDPPARNMSLPHWAVLFLLRCGQAALPDRAFGDVRKALTVLAMKDEPTWLRPGLDVATPDERRRLRDAADAGAHRLASDYGIVLSTPSRAATAFRPFDEDDLRAIVEAIGPWLTQSTRDLLSQL